MGEEKRTAKLLEIRRILIESDFKHYKQISEICEGLYIETFYSAQDSNRENIFHWAASCTVELPALTDIFLFYAGKLGKINPLGEKSLQGETSLMKAIKCGNAIFVDAFFSFSYNVSDHLKDLIPIMKEAQTYMKSLGSQLGQEKFSKIKDMFDRATNLSPELKQDHSTLSAAPDVPIFRKPRRNNISNFSLDSTLLPPSTRSRLGK